MPFDWREFLAVARFLAGHGGIAFSSEAAWRCAVSRAYYAAYCHARNYARDSNWFSPTNKPKDHGRLRACFQKRSMVAVASRLDSLRQWRNDCDYADVYVLPVSLASALAEAQQIIDAL